jgi:dephospho-CoA kinase
MRFIGLTGGIGSGKSTVARMLADRGAVILDSDVFAREVVEPGTPGFDAVVTRFGPEVVTGDGQLDRAALARLVFADEEARRDLEAIIHPAVRRRVAEEVAARVGTHDIVVLDSPLLIETGTYRDCQQVLVVSALPETQIRRLMARGMDEADARARLAAQMPLEDKAAYADVLFDNEGTLEELETQVDRFWEEQS